MVKKQTTYELKIVKVPAIHEPDHNEKITKPEDIVKWASPIRNSMQEHFLCLSLNGSGEIMNNRVITIGLLNHSLVHPREVFRGAILDNAASVILVHNHPSGGLEPSSQDISITNQLKESGTLLGIPVIDHVIITRDCHCSLKERGFL